MHAPPDHAPMAERADLDRGKHLTGHQNGTATLPAEDVLVFEAQPDGFKLMNWETGYGDWIAEPIWDQLRILPWLSGTAMVLADTIDEETGLEIPVSPRTILKRQVARAADAGFAIKAGSEFEFYVLKDSWEDLADRGWPVPKPFGHYNETSKEGLRQAGWEMARTIEPGYVSIGTDKLALPTVRINYGMGLDALIRLIG
jgi:glutamine synthetase